MHMIFGFLDCVMLSKIFYYLILVEIDVVLFLLRLYYEMLYSRLWG